METSFLQYFQRKYQLHHFTKQSVHQEFENLKKQIKPKLNISSHSFRFSLHSKCHANMAITYTECKHTGLSCIMVQLAHRIIMQTGSSCTQDHPERREMTEIKKEKLVGPRLAHCGQKRFQNFSKEFPRNPLVSNKAFV